MMIAHMFIERATPDGGNLDPPLLGYINVFSLSLSLSSWLFSFFTFLYLLFLYLLISSLSLSFLFLWALGKRAFLLRLSSALMLRWTKYEDAAEYKICIYFFIRWLMSFCSSKKLKTEFKHQKEKWKIPVSSHGKKGQPSMVRNANFTDHRSEE